jgi:type II secretory pathway pseudopilin PulG
MEAHRAPELQATALSLTNGCRFVVRRYLGGIMNLRWILLAASLTACASSATRSTDKAAIGAAAICAEPSPRTIENPATMAALLSHIPDKAVAGIIIGPKTMSSSMPLLEDASVKEALAYIKPREGVDVAGFDGLVGFATSLDEKNPSVAVFVRVPITRILKGTTAKTISGVAVVAIEKELFAATLTDGVLVGTLQGVEAGILAARDPNAALSATSALSALISLVKNGAGVALQAAVASVPDPQVAGMAAMFGVASANLSWDGLVVRMVIEGDAAKLPQVSAMIQLGLGQLVQSAADERKKAEDGDSTTAGAVAIWAHGSAVDLAAKLQPKQDGNRLTVEYRLPESSAVRNSSMAVATMGILAAVAVPAFSKYVAKSKSAEAVSNLEAISVALTSQYVALSAKQQKQFRFPVTDWAPAASCCGEAQQQCDATVAFAGDPWKSLGFSPSGKVNYQYRITGKGVGKRATVRIEARGDLNCNQVFSSFTLDGSIHDGQLQFGAMTRENETE